MILFEPYTGHGMLALADGRVFRGLAFGARATVVGEVVFNTSMTGYQEIVTDPSYAGQLVTMTYTQIGNVGVNEADMESRAHGAEGLLVRALSPTVSNWRAEGDLSSWLAARGVPGLGEIDTRALTRHVRTVGALPAALSTEHTDAARLVELARGAPAMAGRGLGAQVSTREPYPWDAPTLRLAAQDRTVPDVDLHAVVVDFGVKLNILRCLRDVGVRATVVPAQTSAEDILALEPDGVFLSNGPGDPAALPGVVEQVRRLLDARPKLPVYGICLGHQLLSLALGGRTYKLKFGHHGGNHPVRAAGDGRVAITAQNHGFAVDAESLAGRVDVTDVNLFDDTVAGVAVRDRPVRAVQYHPEASPGPHDARSFFADFARDMRAARPAQA